MVYSWKNGLHIWVNDSSKLFELVPNLQNFTKSEELPPGPIARIDIGEVWDHKKWDLLDPKSGVF